MRTHRNRPVRARRITGLSRNLWTGTHLNHPVHVPRVNTGSLYHSRGGLKTAHFGGGLYHARGINRVPTGGLYHSAPKFGRKL